MYICASVTISFSLKSICFTIQLYRWQIHSILHYMQSQISLFFATKQCIRCISDPSMIPQLIHFRIFFILFSLLFVGLDGYSPFPCICNAICNFSNTLNDSQRDMDYFRKIIMFVIQFIFK